MVIVQLKGGLGNQLFQYATGRALSLRRGKPLKLDASQLYQPGEDTPRDYELNKFTFRQDFSTARDLAYFGFGTTTSSIQRFVNRVRNAIIPTNVVVEDIRAPYRGRFDEFRGDTFLAGYWQTPTHFHDFQQTIREDLQFRDEVSPKSRQLAQRLIDSNASFLHVRRGDYVQNSKTNGWHGACTEAYYAAAIERMRNDVAVRLIAVFSDDPDWCRSAFRNISDLLIVDKSNSEGSTIDHLQLMSLCQNAIIANSSFSWWGAWLMKNPDKLVIAPRNWVSDPVVNERMRDITPPGWLRL